MKVKNIIFSCILLLLVLVISSQTFAAPAYQDDFYELNVEIENFFYSYEEYALVSHYFITQEFLSQIASYFSEDIYSIGDLYLKWYSAAGSFSNPGIIFDKYGVKLVEFALDYEEDSFSSQAVDFLQTIFSDIIQIGQADEVSAHYDKFRSNGELLYKNEIELANGKKADVYFQMNDSKDKPQVDIGISLKDRDQKLIHQGMEYYSLAIRANEMFDDFPHPLLLYPNDIGEEMYVLIWGSEDGDITFSLSFIKGSKVSMNYMISVPQNDEVEKELNFLFKNLSPEYFEGEILEIIDWLVERCFITNQPIIWEEENSFFILMLFPIKDLVRVYVVFDYML